MQMPEKPFWRQRAAQLQRRSITQMQILSVNDISSSSFLLLLLSPVVRSQRKKKREAGGVEGVPTGSPPFPVHHHVLQGSITSSLTPQSTRTEPSGGKPCPATPSPAAPWTSARGAPFPVTTAWSRCPSTGRWPTLRPGWSTS